MTHILQPRTFSEASTLLREEPSARAVAGGTDLLVRARREGRAFDVLVDLGAITEGKRLVREGDFVRAGALVTFARLAESALVAETLPALFEAASLMGSIQIRERGTIGGNLVNASPAGDAMPPLIVAGAEACLVRGDAARWVPVEDLFVGPGRTILAHDELVAEVRWPVVPNRRSGFARVGNRAFHVITKASAAVAADLDGGHLRNVRVAFGAVAPRPLRASKTEALLEGQRWTPALAEAVAEAAASEIAPIDDIRSTAAYRREVVGRLVGRIVAAWG